MGYTAHTIALISRHLDGVKSVLDIGSQNDYSRGINPPPFVSEWYNHQGIKNYSCIDLAGDNGAIKLDLAKPVYLGKRFDLVVDGGTSEHIVLAKNYKTESFNNGHIHSVYPEGEIKSIEEGFYNCWLNKHSHLKVGGIMVNENPKTGNWPNHGYSYYTKEFYQQLELISGYVILELGEHPASGNTVDGWNIYSVLFKESEKFPNFEEFKKIPIKHE